MNKYCHFLFTAISSSFLYFTWHEIIISTLSKCQKLNNNTSSTLLQLSVGLALFQPRCKRPPPFFFKNYFDIIFEHFITLRLTRTCQLPVLYRARLLLPAQWKIIDFISADWNVPAYFQLFAVISWTLMAKERTNEGRQHAVFLLVRVEMRIKEKEKRKGREFDALLQSVYGNLEEEKCRTFSTAGWFSFSLPVCPFILFLLSLSLEIWRISNSRDGGTTPGGAAAAKEEEEDDGDQHGAMS